MNIKPLNLFYEEPDPDRWFKNDRYIRRIFRTMVRGKQPIGGVMRWFVNLCKGLDKLKVPYQVNNYRNLRKNPGEWALVVGKPQVIEKIPDSNPIIFGPGIAAHPFDNDFWQQKQNIKHILISCKWFKDMYDRDLPVSIPTTVWPSGVETELWLPNNTPIKPNSILVYDKIRWERNHYISELINPIIKTIENSNITYYYIKYGNYKEKDFMQLLKKVRAMVFLCEHETQGFAYLQTLSCNVPIFAWDRGGVWKDPTLYPHKVIFEPVTSVPYWDNKCGDKFVNFTEFEIKFNHFWQKTLNNDYQPRNYVLENFKLESRAKAYLEIINKIQNN